MDEKPIVWMTLSGVVDNGTITRSIPALYQANSSFSQINLLISSPGGHIASAVTIANVIKSLQIPVSTFNMGAIESCATLIYLAGSKRHTCDTASFMFHQPYSAGLQGSGSPEALQGAHDSLVLDIIRHRDMVVAAGTTFDEKMWNIIERGNLHMNATDAIRTGVAHCFGLFSPTPGAPLHHV